MGEKKKRNKRECVGGRKRKEKENGEIEKIIIFYCLVSE
jgi:hypothetical protein